jgi:hypothetical protein
MIEGDYQCATALPKNPLQPNCFPKIAHDFSPVKRYNTRVM